MNLLIPVVGLGIGAVLLGAGCGRPTASRSEEAGYDSLRDQVVRRVKAGEIVPDATGVATLGEGLASASCNGQIIVGQTPSTGWIVAFPLRESGVAMQCFLYLEQPAPSGDQSLQVGGFTLTVGSRSQGNWYQGGLQTR